MNRRDLGMYWSPPNTLKTHSSHNHTQLHTYLHTYQRTCERTNTPVLHNYEHTYRTTSRYTTLYYTIYTHCITKHMYTTFTKYISYIAYNHSVHAAHTRNLYVHQTFTICRHHLYIAFTVSVGRRNLIRYLVFLESTEKSR